MSSHYNTEPPPTASVTLHTTAGPIHISLFARQTPLACKNFVQHCLDGYYKNTTFHRVAPAFVVQAGDPTGTGAGGASIYEDPEFERDYSRDKTHGEKVVFGDEIHSRLRFNRRGLVGMAKGEDGSYGSQFFVTLAAAERDLTGSSTLFGRVEGESIYNIVSIAEGELVEGTERPVYAVTITGCEVDELGPFEGVLRKREKVAAVSRPEDEEEDREAVKKTKRAKKKGKGAKALLSFGADEEDEDEEGEGVPIPTKRKFNPKVVADADVPAASQPERGSKKKDEDRQSPNRSMPPPRPSESSSKPPRKRSRSRSRSPQQAHSPPVNRKPPRDPYTQIPVPDPEEPSRSPSPSSPPSANSPNQSSLSRTNAEIASLKASMRRNGSSISAEPPRKKTALESLIPETSIRGRRRPGTGTDGGGVKVNSSTSSTQDGEALRVFNAFRAKLENAGVSKSRAREQAGTATATTTTGKGGGDGGGRDNDDDEGEEEEEAQLCDLHFIANCQSCQAWDAPPTIAEEEEYPGTHTTTAPKHTGEDADSGAWMTHRLSFTKDTLGKDASWKREHPEDADGLMVIDPRQKEKEIIGGGGRKRERERKLEDGAGSREWDRERRGGEKGKAR